jgi:transglycosylase-like protein
MFAGLLIVAPSVANAPALARAVDKAHHVAYPGQPVPERFAASLVATEDHRFYSEADIDPFGIAGVTADFLMGKPDQGGSTLNQQLAKILYVPGRGALAKSEQILLGVKLALSYHESEILQMYSSVAYFGHGYYGLQAASCGYFAVAPAALTWPQAAARGPGAGADCGRPAHPPPPRQGPGGTCAGPSGCHGKAHAGSSRGRIPATAAPHRGSYRQMRRQERREITTPKVAVIPAGLCRLGHLAQARL